MLEKEDSFSELLPSFCNIFPLLKLTKQMMGYFPNG